MALGNLSIKVTADIGNFTSGMDAAAVAARQGMGTSAGSVDDFRQHLMRASDDLAQASRAMGANMEAANDAIVSSSARAADAVQGVSKSIDAVDTRSMHEKVAFAVGAGVGAGAAAGKTAIDAFISYLETKLVIAGLVILTGITAGVFTVLYLASKAVGAIGAMMDGSFYKSENIDGLIATNKELLDLQKNLRISSIEAGALNEAMKRLNVDKGNYTAVYDGATKAIHENGEELDRLGVKYKDQNGKLLENRQFIENVKVELDKYTEGWDRNAAAVAMGVGSYDKIVDVLRITDTELQTSKSRMDEYQLGITAGTQQMVAEYQQAMRDFDAENRMAGEGFKRVFADAVMPIYTDMANLFKEGWPSIVQATRVGVSSVMFLVYAMADGIYIAKESIMASFSVIGSGIGAIAAASVKIMQGDFTGAKNTLAMGWEDAATRVKLAGTNIVDQVMRNDRAIMAATGNDGRNASLASSKLADPVTGKAFVAKLKEEKAAGAGANPNDDPAKKFLQGEIAAQEAFIAAEKTQLSTREQYLQYYYTQEYTTAADFYGTKNKLIQDALKSQLEAYDKETAAAVIYQAQANTDVKIQDAKNIIADIAKKRAAAELEANKKQTDSVLEQDAIYNQFRLTTDAVARSAALNNAQAQFQIDLLGKGTLEVAKLTEARKIDLALEQKIYDNRLKVIPEADVAAAAAGALMQKNAAMGVVEDSYNRQRTAIFGATEAMRKYAESTGNQAAQVEWAMTNAFKGAEDAFVNFVKTGKLGFKDFANVIIDQLIRIQAQKMVAAVAGGGGLGSIIGSLFGGGTKGNNPSAFVSGGSFTDSIGKFFTGLGFADGGSPPVGMASMVGERGPEMFVPNQAGTIIPNHKLGGGGENITIINQTTGRIDNVVSQSISPGERQLIIQETREAVAADHYDPNSRVSRAMKNNYTAARVR